MRPDDHAHTIFRAEFLNHIFAEAQGSTSRVLEAAQLFPKGKQHV